MAVFHKFLTDYWQNRQEPLRASAGFCWLRHQKMTEIFKNVHDGIHAEKSIWRAAAEDLQNKAPI